MADSIETNKTNLAAQYPDAPDDVIQAWAEIKYNEDTYAEEFGWKDRDEKPVISDNHIFKSLIIFS